MDADLMDVAIYAALPRKDVQNMMDISNIIER